MKKKIRHQKFKIIQSRSVHWKKEKNVNEELDFNDLMYERKKQFLIFGLQSILNLPVEEGNFPFQRLIGTREGGEREGESTVKIRTKCSLLETLKPCGTNCCTFVRKSSNFSHSVRLFVWNDSHISSDCCWSF